MIKIIGYARVSTTKQDLSRQKLKIKEFCENNNYELIEIIEDFGISVWLQTEKVISNYKVKPTKMQT
ncbi:recombinase family protein [Bacteroides uniformis]|nr:recombinase family protein [Bacteroides uniformis]